jgi:hypothetical protein
MGWNKGETSRSLEDFDHEPQPDGIYIAELVFVDEGPGDWPGSRETSIGVRNWRLATAAEWEEYVEGNWPWNEDGSES